MTATCLNTNGMEAVLRICCCAAGSMVFHGRKTTALSLTVSTPLKTIAVGQVGQGTFDAPNPIVHRRLPASPLAIRFALDEITPPGEHRATLSPRATL